MTGEDIENIRRETGLDPSDFWIRFTDMTGNWFALMIPERE